MKLLSSDYDKTLNTFDYDLMFNMVAIERFMREGNVFLLNTGRSYKSIKREIDKHRIKYDYLGCCDGNLLLRKNDDIIYCTNLELSIYDELKKLEEKYKNMIVTPIMHNDRILEFEVKMYFENTECNIELYNICHKYGLSHKVFEQIEFKNLKLVRVRNIYLCDQKVSKSSATKLVGELENISKCDIFTIGDHHNDIEMIRAFNGYTLPWAKQEVKNVSNGVCLSVAGLVKKMQRR